MVCAALAIALLCFLSVASADPVPPKFQLIESQIYAIYNRATSRNTRSDYNFHSSFASGQLRCSYTYTPHNTANAPLSKVIAVEFNRAMGSLIENQVKTHFTQHTKCNANLDTVADDGVAPGHLHCDTTIACRRSLFGLISMC
ncbi:hypothetical protein PRIPAC_86414 [Pristionchus pacificus]|uniref:Uncharacterized protein n=1 Tax=Pristionchus pacificus TaxID=54126 RepID=A0A2A6BKI4_PRIPA|nr:hypothetical protein PRIPAC_86414 [Pristionchus pacificus]|eukprot:PDM66425.1 hypothetical protein PRIPAC_47842 [Pristionchus pacificus]